MNDVYQQQPVLVSPAITLRPVRREDAEELLRVYGDPTAVPYFNGDNCHGDTFYYPTLARMKQAIDFWLFSYREKYFVRWSILENRTAQVIGTIELFDRVSGDAYHGCVVLRLDVRHDHETMGTLTSVLHTLLPKALEGFRGRTVITKCWPYATQRQQALERMGFAPSSEPLVGENGTAYDHYWRLDG